MLLLRPTEDVLMLTDYSVINERRDYFWRDHGNRWVSALLDEVV
jgi:hypothetical protein